MSFETRTLLSPDMLRRLLPDLGEWKENGLRDLRIAVLGFGKMGIMHSAIMNLLKPSSVKAVVDKSRLVHFGASRIVKDIKFYTDLDKMLAREEPDVVYVTTPTASHRLLLLKLIAHGVKYVFVEKPPTVNLKELREISSISKKDQVIMVGLQKRFALPFRHARMLLSDRIIGDIQTVCASTRSGDIISQTTRFNSLSRGVLLDLGIHLIDLLTWLFDVETVVRAEYGSIYTKVDDYFNAELLAKDGVRIRLDVTWSDPAYRIPETCIEVHGSLGTLRVSEDHLVVEMSSKEKPRLAMYKPHYYQGIPPVNIADPEYVLENMHFLSSIYQSKQPLVSLQEASRAMGLVDELYERGSTYND